MGVPMMVELERVTLTLCSLCLDGAGGECHTPGCALWINRAPDISIRDKAESPKWTCLGCGATTGRYDNGDACTRCVLDSFAEWG